MTYFFSPRWDVNELFIILENRLIHNSNVPSKQELTTESSIPSKILKVLTTWKTRNSIFYLRTVASSWVPVNKPKSTERISPANLCKGSSELGSLYEVYLRRKMKNSTPASMTIGS